MSATAALSAATVGDLVAASGDRFTLTIIIGQVPELLGISKGSGDFFEKVWHVVTHLGDIDGLTCAVGLVSLAAVVALKRFVPALPGSLPVVLVAIAAVALLDLDDHGLDIVGTIPAGLPPVGWPDVDAHDFGSLAPGAIGVMLVGFAVEAADMLTELRAALPSLRFEKLRAAAPARLAAESSDPSEVASPVTR